MYLRILLALECSATDDVLLAHVVPLAQRLGSALLLTHVADGWVARNYTHLHLAESDEMREDRRYLEALAARLAGETGLDVEAHLALGDPAAQIVRVAEEAGCDLIALASHGHRFVGDVLRGSTIDKVRHRSRVPILAVRQPPGVPDGRRAEE